MRMGIRLQLLLGKGRMGPLHLLGIRQGGRGTGVRMVVRQLGIIRLKGGSQCT